MNATGSKRLVLTSLTATGALAIVHRITKGQAPDVVRVLVGAFIAGAALTFTAEFLPDVAATLALLALVAVVVYGGPDVFDAITARTRARITTRPSASDGSVGIAPIPNAPTPGVVEA